MYVPKPLWLIHTGLKDSGSLSIDEAPVSNPTLTAADPSLPILRIISNGLPQRSQPNRAKVAANQIRNHDKSKKLYKLYDYFINPD